MRIQYGQILTLVALCVAAKGSSIEDALGGLSNGWPDQILNELNTLDSYPAENRYNGPSQDYQDYQDNHDYDYNYDILADKLSLPTRSVDNAAPSLNAAPKASASDSQDNSAFRTNSMLPAYCDPPNPCPIGYTTADGCIEDFENSSEFSRGFQSRQKCICDTEHMFDCPEENAHRGADDITAVNILSDLPGLKRSGEENNPYLGGQKLPVAAKKGHF